MQDDYTHNSAGILVPRRYADGLENLVSGLGTSKSKRAHNRFAYGMLNNYVELDAAYQSNWIARAIVDYPAEDMTREWRTFKCNDADAIKMHEEELGVPEHTQEAVCWARLYGGSAILMITDQDLEKPLNIDKVKKGGLKRLLTVDRWMLSGPTLNTHDVLAKNFLMPEYFTIEGGIGQRIHWSHFALFTGARLPLRHRRQLQGWGDSELRKCLEDIKDTVAAKDGIAELMQEANVDVITREGLNEALTSLEEEDALRKRYELYSQMKSIINMALLDEGETMDRLTLQLSGVAPIIDTFMTWISGAADIPLTRLFGTSAKGMNATGEGDLKNYYNSLRSKQSSQLNQPLSWLDQVLARSAVGSMPSDFTFDWNPLEQQSDVEVAQASYMRAQEDDLHLANGVINRSQVQRRLQANEAYQFDEAKINELEKLENSAMFEEPVTGDPEAPEEESPTGIGLINENGQESDLAVDPQSSLNGAQVTAILEIISRIRTGEISKSTAIKVIATSFPVSEEEANSLVSDVPEGTDRQGEKNSNGDP